MTTYPKALAALIAAALVQGGCHSAPDESDDGETEVAVHVGKVTRTTLRRYVNAYGRVAPKPALGREGAGAATLSAPAPGIVRTVLVTEGQRVHAGDLVVRFEDRIASAEETRARARVRLAEQTLEREKTLWEGQNTSQKQVQAAEEAVAAARADLGTARGALALVQLRTPLDGIVSRIRVSPGESVDANTPVAEILDLNELVILARVPAREASAVKVDQLADVRLDRDGDPAATARVSYVSPEVDPATETVLVRLSLSADSHLQPGRFVRIQIAVEERADRLAVPVASVYTSPEGESELWVVEDGVAHRKTVHTGVRDGASVEVESDELKAGMTVVTVGSYALPETTRVHVVTDE